MAHVNSSDPTPLPLAAAASRQQWWWRHGAMINNNWQTLMVELMDMREIPRIVGSNTVKIDLPTWLWSEPYRHNTAAVLAFIGLKTDQPYQQHPVWWWWLVVVVVVAVVVVMVVVVMVVVVVAIATTVVVVVPVQYRYTVNHSYISPA